MPDSFYLQSAAGEKLIITEGENSVGRVAGNTILVANAKVSSHHALITRHGDLIWIEDKNSANGTFVNEERITPGQKRPLRDGDVIKFSLGSIYVVHQMTAGTTMPPSSFGAETHTTKAFVRSYEERKVESRQSATMYSEPTRLLCAAAHLVPSIYDQFRAYDKLKYKAHTPEYYIDVEKIRVESEKGLQQERLHRLAHLAIIIFIIVFWVITDLSGMVVLMIAWFFAFLIDVIFDYNRQKYVREHFLAFDSRTDYQVQPEEQNVIIYSGFSPFVGSGITISNWSVTIDLTKPMETEQPLKKITESELFAEVSAAIGNLRIPQLHQKDLLFVAGTDLRTQKEILPDIFEQPNTNVDHYLIEQHLGKKNPIIRHYRMIQVPAWNGQLVLSIFLRFVKEGENLIIEFNAYLLPPIGSLYSAVDMFTSEIGLRAVIQMIFSNLFTSLFSWLSPIGWFLQEIELDTLGLGEAEQSKIKHNYRYDYGRAQSFRERWTDNRFYRYYQKLDQETYFSILGERVLDATADALEARGISVKKLREQSKTILNQGLIISGGNVNADNLAIGAKAAIKNLISGTQFRQGGNQSLAVKQNDQTQQR